MTLTPIGYVVQIRVADVLCLYFTRLSQGGIDLTADLDKAMLFDTEERAGFRPARRLRPARGRAALRGGGVFRGSDAQRRCGFAGR